MTLVSNRYRVVRELGRGGFGRTSLVEDTQLPSGRRCVLKELLLIESSPEIYNLVKQRFEREAVLLEELGNLTLQIPSLYAYFAENNKFYLVQEYIEGDTIAGRVQSQGVMSDAAVREWLSGLLPILSLIHDRNIIHRDIKPENIILSQRDHKPVLIDFGAVRETMGTAINSQGNTTRSIVIGTPGFMASEQAAGRAVYGSDLYSLGLTAIYALTGKIPQELPTDGRTGDIEWRQFAPTVSGGLAAVIDRAIAPHSRDRCQTSGQMLDELLRSNSVTRMPGTTLSMSPGFEQAPMMTTPPNNGNSGNYQPTVISANVNPYPYQQPMSQHPVPMSNNHPKTWIMAVGVGGMVILAGVGVMALVKDKDKTQVAQEPTPAQTSTTSAAPVTTNNRTETQKEPVAAQNQPIPESLPPSPEAISETNGKSKPILPTSSRKKQEGKNAKSTILSELPPGKSLLQPTIHKGYCTLIADSPSKNLVDDPCTIYEYENGAYKLLWSMGKSSDITSNPSVLVDNAPAVIIDSGTTNMTIKSTQGKIGFCWNCTP
jgi:serine/threonine-protein kinase